MRPGDMVFTVECLQHGQPRPYADHQYDYVLTIERVSHKTGELEPALMSDDYARQKMKALAIHWKESDENPSWASTICTSFSSFAPGKWRLIATAAYTG